MLARNGRILFLISVIGAAPLLAADTEQTIESFRIRLKELGHLAVLADEGRKPEEPRGPKDRTPEEEALYQIVRMPRAPLRAAMRESLQNGDQEEAIGALAVYMLTVNTSGNNFEREPFHPEYLRVLLDRLNQDDLRLPTYTRAICGALTLYPSRETYVVIMSAAKRSESPKLHYQLVDLTAARLGIELGIHLQMPEAEQQRIWNDFEAWFWKNEKRISFDSEGRASVAGERGRTKPRGLSGDERARIRKNPACVLELFQGMTTGIEASEEKMEGLLQQCGDSLFGSEGVKAIQSALTEARKAGKPNFDQQMGLAAARTKYPTFDAGLLAVAYVAADDPDPKHRELAKKTLDDIGTVDEISRVLRGESKEVQRKALELANEIIEKGS